MLKWTIHRWCAGATALLMLIFAGNRVAQPRALPQQPPAASEETTLPPETVPEVTLPPTEPEPGWYALCAEAAGAVKAEHVFVYDLEREQMIFCAASAQDRLYPASITKLFSAYVALEVLEADAVVTAGYELGMVQPGSSTAYIALGSKLTVEDLISAMLLPSGNDAAYVVAAAAGRAIAGNPELDYREAVEIFLEEMNREGERLGLVNSHFTNPDGYHGEDHYSCAEDIARIAVLALDEPVISRAVGTFEETVEFVSGGSVTWRNTNRLLNPESEYYRADATGMKTGYTKKAGYCLLAAFQEGERKILVGIFGSQDKVSRYGDAADIFDACLSGA